MLHVSLEKGKYISLERKENKEGYIYVFEGKGMLNEETFQFNTAYTLHLGDFTVQAKEDMQFIYAEGTPLKEPIAWKGPIVMNTREEIEQTFKDLQDGTFI